MKPYPLPPGITREQFRSLVAQLFQQLDAKGVDPLANLITEDMDEVGADGQTRPHFEIFISETAAQILGKNPH